MARVLLAPMEGQIDCIMRDLFTQLGGFDYCVTEFIRVTSQVLPEKVFLRDCPELDFDCRTPAGTPVFVQLLGSDLEMMAANAARAASLGAYGIDINFGCPAKTVNRHDGGAVLLKSPERVWRIVQAVRAAVPEQQPVTAKIRLGFEDKSLALENAQAAEAGGAHWLTVHARTKLEGYRPPAHWEHIARIREAVTLPVIANGDIWNVKDYQQCRSITGCEDVMIGRGAVKQPDLALQIKHTLNGQEVSRMMWRELLTLIERQFLMGRLRHHENYGVVRLKQWLRHLGQNYPAANELFADIRTLKDADDVSRVLQEYSGPTFGREGSEWNYLRETATAPLPQNWPPNE